MCVWPFCEVLLCVLNGFGRFFSMFPMDVVVMCCSVSHMCLVIQCCVYNVFMILVWCLLHVFVILLCFLNGFHRCVCFPYVFGHVS